MSFNVVLEGARDDVLSCLVNQQEESDVDCDPQNKAWWL